MTELQNISFCIYINKVFKVIKVIKVFRMKKHFRNISASCLHQFICLKIKFTIFFIQINSLI